MVIELGRQLTETLLIFLFFYTDTFLIAKNEKNPLTAWKIASFLK